jgi:hypothetical protein
MIPWSNKIIPLSKAERKSISIWNMKNVGLFGKKMTARARRAAIKKLDKELGFNA